MYRGYFKKLVTANKITAHTVGVFCSSRMNSFQRSLQFQYTIYCNDKWIASIQGPNIMWIINSNEAEVSGGRYRLSNQYRHFPFPIEEQVDFRRVSSNNGCPKEDWSEMDAEFAKDLQETFATLFDRAHDRLSTAFNVGVLFASPYESSSKPEMMTHWFLSGNERKKGTLLVRVYRLIKSVYI